MASSILRLRDVIARTGLPRSTIYLRMSQGAFPTAISLGYRTVGWLADEIDQWIESRIAQSRGLQAASSESTFPPSRNASR